MRIKAMYKPPKPETELEESVLEDIREPKIEFGPLECVMCGFKYRELCTWTRRCAMCDMSGEEPICTECGRKGYKWIKTVWHACETPSGIDKCKNCGTEYYFEMNSDRPAFTDSYGDGTYKSRVKCAEQSYTKDGKYKN